MSNEITKVLEAEVKRIAVEIQSLESKIASLKGQQAALNSTVDFYRGTGKKAAAPAAKPSTGAKRGPKPAPRQQLLLLPTRKSQAVQRRLTHLLQLLLSLSQL
jgi:hypothetical protein